MNRVYFATLFPLIVGCAARQTPAPIIAASPTIVATPTPIVVVSPPVPTQATATPDAELTRVVAELERLKSASPERDFATAWANKNTKFVAVRGVGWHLPGVPQNRESALLDQYDADPIKGTTDFIYAPEVARLNAAATRYATRYNQLLLAKLDAQTKAN